MAALTSAKDGKERKEKGDQHEWNGWVNWLSTHAPWILQGPTTTSSLSSSPRMIDSVVCIVSQSSFESCMQMAFFCQRPFVMQLEEV